MSLLASILAPLIAVAAVGLAVGDTFPSISSKDITGETRNTGEFAGRPTVVVIITDRSGEQGMRDWWSAAEARVPSSVQRKSLVSIGVPFFISSGTVRRMARDDTPRQEWGDTLLDTNHGMAKDLGLEKSDTPWVFILDEHGRILAQAHSDVGSAEAQEIWRALGTLGR